MKKYSPHEHALRLARKMLADGGLAEWAKEKLRYAQENPSAAAGDALELAAGSTLRRMPNALFGPFGVLSPSPLNAGEDEDARRRRYGQPVGPQYAQGGYAVGGTPEATAPIDPLELARRIFEEGSSWPDNAPAPAPSNAPPAPSSASPAPSSASAAPQGATPASATPAPAAAPPMSAPQEAPSAAPAPASNPYGGLPSSNFGSNALSAGQVAAMGGLGTPTGNIGSVGFAHGSAFPTNSLLPSPSIGQLAAALPSPFASAPQAATNAAPSAAPQQNSSLYDAFQSFNQSFNPWASSPTQAAPSKGVQQPTMMPPQAPSYWSKPTPEEDLRASQIQANPPSAGAMGPPSAKDIDALAEAMLGEARGQGAAGMTSVGQSINNRASSNYSGYGGIQGQINAPNQFSYRGTSNQTAARNALNNNTPLGQTAIDIAKGVLMGTAPNDVGSRTDYRAQNQGSKTSVPRSDSVVTNGHNFFSNNAALQAYRDALAKEAKDREQSAQPNQSPSNGLLGGSQGSAATPPPPVSNNAPVGAPQGGNTPAPESSGPSPGVSAPVAPSIGVNPADPGFGSGVGLQSPSQEAPAAPPGSAQPSGQQPTQAEDKESPNDAPSNNPNSVFGSGPPQGIVGAPLGLNDPAPDIGIAPPDPTPSTPPIDIEGPAPPPAPAPAPEPEAPIDLGIPVPDPPAPLDPELSAPQLPGPDLIASIPEGDLPAPNAQPAMLEGYDPSEDDPEGGVPEGGDPEGGDPGGDPGGGEDGGDNGGSGSSEGGGSGSAGDEQRGGFVTHAMKIARKHRKHGGPTISQLNKMIADMQLPDTDENRTHLHDLGQRVYQNGAGSLTPEEGQRYNDLTRSYNFPPEVGSDMTWEDQLSNRNQWLQRNRDPDMEPESYAEGGSVDEYQPAQYDAMGNVVVPPQATSDMKPGWIDKASELAARAVANPITNNLRQNTVDAFRAGQHDVDESFKSARGEDGRLAINALAQYPVGLMNMAFSPMTGAINSAAEGVTQLTGSKAIGDRFGVVAGFAGPEHVGAFKRAVQIATDPNLLGLGTIITAASPRFPHANLPRALEMQKQGAPLADIYRETQIDPSTFSKPVAEVSDADMRLKSTPGEINNYQVVHPELEAAAPGLLARTRQQITHELGTNPEGFFEYDPDFKGKLGNIEVVGPTLPQVKDTLAHELQHAVSAHEGQSSGGDWRSAEFEKSHAKLLEEHQANWNRLGKMAHEYPGGPDKWVADNPSAAASLEKSDYILQNYADPYAAYQVLEDEVKARDVAARRNLTQEELENRPITEDMKTFEGEPIDPNHMLQHFGGRRAIRAMSAERAPRQLNDIGLYSHGAETAGAFQQAKGTPEQYAAMLQKAGVKPAEMEGFGEAFAGRPSVTREEIAKHFQQRMPQVEETVLGGRKPVLSETEKEKWIDAQAAERALETSDIENVRDWDNASPEIRDWHREEAIENFNERMANDFGFAEKFNDYVGTPTKFDQYTLPGGENYREVLLKLNRPQAKVVELEGGGGRWGVQMPDGTITSRYYEKFDAEQALRFDAAKQGVTFTSQHWDDPDVIAHLRMADRNGPNGEKILHVEELQSDWGQQGKKEGFVTQYKPEDIKPMDPANITSERRRNEFWNFETPTGAIDVPRNDRWPTMEAARQYILDNVKPTGIPTAPYVTSTPAWTDLALKRALKEAAEGGYDKLVWTPGAEQAKRYSLTNTMSRIGYEPATGELWALDRSGEGIPQIESRTFKPEELPGVIGKDATEKLLSTEPNANGFHVLNDQEIPIGGEGMKGYYDKIVPKRLQEIIKKHDPSAKVGMGRLPVEGGNKGSEDIARELGMSIQEINALPYAEKRALIDSVRNTIVAPSLTITPKMRESILRGQTHMAEGGSVVDRALTLIRGR